MVLFAVLMRQFLRHIYLADSILRRGRSNVIKVNTSFEGHGETVNHGFPKCEVRAQLPGAETAYSGKAAW